jgi:3',5'-cyclic AMP phosphodiesterase CpdA
MNPLHLAHFSDVHVTARPLGWSRRDWLSKRVTGWLNLRLLGRGRRFRHAEDVLTVLAGELKQRRPDHVVFSGDATSLGFEAEVARAARLLGLHDDPLPGIAVPGNHDYYTASATASGAFERHFARWQVGERVDDAVYPFAQRVGPAWLIGVNSSTANRGVFDASGAVGRAQLDRLARLLDRLGDGLRILVTHYPVCLHTGAPENRAHYLRDLADLVTVAARGGVKLWLHGHRHNAYSVVDSAKVPFPVVCAGSATQTGHWSYANYVLEGNRLHVRRRVFDPEAWCFRDGETAEVSLPA